MLISPLYVTFLKTSRFERTASQETLSYIELRFLSLSTGSGCINWVIENMSSAGQRNKCMQNDDASFVCFPCCMCIHSAINNTLGSLTCSCFYSIVLKSNSRNYNWTPYGVCQRPRSYPGRPWHSFSRMSYVWLVINLLGLSTRFPMSPW